MFKFKLMDLVPKSKKSSVVRRVEVYSYYPMRSDLGVALRRDIREHLTAR